MIRATRLVPPLLVLATMAGPALAHTIVDVAARCERCTLDLERNAVLAGDRIAGEPMALVRTADGGYVASFYPRGDEVLAFTSTGAFRCRCRPRATRSRSAAAPRSSPRRRS